MLNANEDHAELYRNYQKNIYMKPQINLPSQTDLITFIKNPGNIIMLQQFLMQRFKMCISTNEALQSVDSFKEKCYDLKRKCEVNEHVCNQIEADTNFLFHGNYM